MEKKLKRVLKAAADESESLRLLQKNPAAFARKVGLGRSDVDALRGADLLVLLIKNPLVMQTSTPITITAKSFGLPTNTGDPARPNRLDQVSRAQLVKILQRALKDPEYARAVRRYLRG